MSTPIITAAMIRAVKACEEFYGVDGPDELSRFDLCHGAMNDDAFNKFWDANPCDCEIDRLARALEKVVWRKG